MQIGAFRENNFRIDKTLNREECVRFKPHSLIYHLPVRNTYLMTRINGVVNRMLLRTLKFPCLIFIG